MVSKEIFFIGPVGVWSWRFVGYERASNDTDRRAVHSYSTFIGCNITIMYSVSFLFYFPRENIVFRHLLVLLLLSVSQSSYTHDSSRLSNSVTCVVSLFLFLKRSQIITVVFNYRRSGVFRVIFCRTSFRNVRGCSRNLFRLFMHGEMYTHPET